MKTAIKIDFYEYVPNAKKGYEDITPRKIQYCISSLNGVEFNIIQKSQYTFNFPREAIIEINSISNGNFAVLSLQEKDDSFELIKNEIVTVNSTVKFQLKKHYNLIVGISSFEEWIREQSVLTENNTYQKLMRVGYISTATDIEFIVNSGEDTDRLPAHSLVLSIKSEYFLHLFKSGFSETETHTIEVNISKNAMSQILEYVYIGKLDKSVITKENYSLILEIYLKVCEFQIEDLKEILEAFILGYLEKNNLKLLMESGILGHDDPFTKKAFKLIALII